RAQERPREGITFGLGPAGGPARAGTALRVACAGAADRRAQRLVDGSVEGREEVAKLSAGPIEGLAEADLPGEVVPEVALHLAVDLRSVLGRVLLDEQEEPALLVLMGLVAELDVVAMGDVLEDVVERQARVALGPALDDLADATEHVEDDRMRPPAAADEVRRR